MKQKILVKYALKVYLLDWKCHYFPGGVGVWREPTCHYVTWSLLALGGVGVKANFDNVTKYEVVFF